jgi:hypothetical protein
MLKWICLFIASCSFTIAHSATEDIQPLVVKEILTDRKVTVLKLGFHFVTTIQLPEAINSIIIGDPGLFKVEHSEKEPQLVFVKPTTQEIAQTNLLITTVGRRQIRLLLRTDNQIETGQEAQRKVHFLLQYESANRFVIDQAGPSSLMVSETVPLLSDVSKHLSKPSSSRPALEASTSLIESLLSRQRRSALPSLHGDSLRVGISEVLENGPYFSVLLSVVNPGKEQIDLMPPQVQLSGLKRSGGIIHRSHSYISEQVPVSDFRLSSRRVEANERIDGVVLFEKPMFKESNQSLFLQVSTWDAVDRPVLVPVPLGVRHFIEGEFQ